MADKKRKRRLAGKTMRDYFPLNLLERKYVPWRKRPFYRIRKDKEARRALEEGEKRFKRDLTLDRIAALEEGSLSPGDWYYRFRLTLLDCLSKYKFSQSMPAERVSGEKRFITDPEKFADDILISQMRKHVVDPIHPSKEDLRKLAESIAREVRKTLGRDAANKIESYLLSRLGE